MNSFTIHVPSEGISQLLSIYLHVQADRNQRLYLRCILVDHCRVMVIKAEKEKTLHISLLLIIQETLSALHF